MLSNIRYVRSGSRAVIVPLYSAFVRKAPGILCPLSASHFKMEVEYVEGVQWKAIKMMRGPTSHKMRV